MGPGVQDDSSKLRAMGQTPAATPSPQTYPQIAPAARPWQGINRVL